MNSSFEVKGKMYANNIHVGLIIIEKILGKIGTE